MMVRGDALQLGRLPFGPGNKSRLSAGITLSAFRCFATCGRRRCEHAPTVMIPATVWNAVRGSTRRLTTMRDSAPSKLCSVQNVKRTWSTRCSSGSSPLANTSATIAGSSKDLAAAPFFSFGGTLRSPPLTLPPPNEYRSVARGVNCSIGQGYTTGLQPQRPLHLRSS